jgi:hypothetical protein
VTCLSGSPHLLPSESARARVTARRDALGTRDRLEVRGRERRGVVVEGEHPAFIAALHLHAVSASPSMRVEERPAGAPFGAS